MTPGASSRVWYQVGFMATARSAAARSADTFCGEPSFTLPRLTSRVGLAFRRAPGGEELRCQLLAVPQVEARPHPRAQPWHPKGNHRRTPRTATASGRGSPGFG